MALTAQPPTSSFEGEIARLTQGDSPREKERFSALVRHNGANWEQSRRDDMRAAEWALVEAYSARTDAQEDPSSVFYAERHAFCRDRVHELAARDGLPYAHAEPRRLTLLRRYWPHLALRQP